MDQKRGQNIWEKYIGCDNPRAPEKKLGGRRTKLEKRGKHGLVGENFDENEKSNVGAIVEEKKKPKGGKVS